jgi:putative zinc finger/helix-turn-helix YgiT family protein
MPNKKKLFSFQKSAEITCPSCGKSKINTRKEEDSFSYGTGKNAVELTAKIPVHRCEECNFEFTDDTADLAKHEVICRHLNVSTPAEIVQIRERFGLSRTAFARITKIGEASINRWETGQLIQGGAMDQYLYLLTFHENFERIRNRQRLDEQSVVRAEKLSWKTRLTETFVALKDNDGILLEEAEAFRL